MKKNDWIFLFFLIGVVFLSLSFFVVDPDYLWHVKAGEYMVHHGLLTKDVFSWSVASKYWVSHEWLFEILIYGFKRVFGSLHLFVYCFLFVLLLLLTIFHANKKYLNHNFLFTVIWFGCSYIIGASVQGRPQMISNCFLAFTVYFLYDLFQNENSKKIYFLPVITILWANIHGGSSNLPYLLCLLFMVAGSFKFRFAKMEATRLTKKQYLKYSIVMILCMLSVCINLHGFKMFLYPYQNMMDTVMIQNIAEWHSTSLNEPTHYFYFVLLLIVICIFLFSKKRIHFIDFMLLGFCAFLGLKSIRFWPYTYIVMSFVVFPYVGKLYPPDRMARIVIVCMTFFLFVLFSLRADHILKPSYYYNLNDKDIQAVKKVKPKRLFNMYNYGGDLIYNDIKVFIDGRADLYGKYNYHDYLAMSSLNNDYVSMIQGYNFDYLLVDQAYPIATYLRYDPKYEMIYQNNNVLLYKKKN